MSKIKGEQESRRVWIDGVELLPDESQKMRNHSPDGFNWGYTGSGPSQLALAIMLHCTDKEVAGDTYQDFKREVVAGWKGDFEVEIDVEKWSLDHYVSIEQAKEAYEDEMRRK